MIHPDTQVRYINKEIGWGVVATRFIPMGTIVWSLDALDQKFPPGQVAEMPAHYREILDKYAFRDKDGMLILCWDNSRFINHSFRPNCLPTPYDMELAVRDIAPGEELTDHYGALNIDSPFTALPEPGIRRRKVYPDDILRHHRAWDKQLERAFRYFSDVEQPLLHLIPEHFMRTIKAVVARQQPMDSCLETYYRCDETADSQAEAG